MSKKHLANIVKKAAATVAARHAADENKMVDAPSSPVVTSSPSSVNAVSGEKTMTYTFVRTNADRKGSSLVFKADGVPGLFKGPKSMFGATVATDASFTVEAPEGLFGIGGSKKAKLTKEERAALRAAETPAQRLEKAKATAARQAARIAKLEAALG